jgi:hypothetical protein
VRGFLKIRKKIGNYFLVRKMKNHPRKKELHNFDTAKTAGILFDANDVDSFKSIKEFSKYLKSLGINTRLLGFAESKEMPDEMVLWDDCDLINIKDIDWLLRPKAEVAGAFIKEEFNLMFDLSIDYNFTICYISNLSAANFKIGRFAHHDHDFDFMIDISKQPSIDFFIEQIKNYVSILNKPEEKVKT